MENSSNGNSGRESFDTENSQSLNQSFTGKDFQNREASPPSDAVKDMDPRYDTNPNRNNFGLDDSPLVSAEWNKDSNESNIKKAGRELDTESDDSETGSSRRNDLNISFDRDL